MTRSADDRGDVPELYQAETYFRDPRWPLQVECHPQASRVALHRHDFVEIVYVRGGSGTHVMDDDDGGEREHPIGSGDVFVVVPGQRHGYRNNRDLLLANVLFLPELVREELPRAEQPAGLEEFFLWDPLRRASTGEEERIQVPVAARGSIEGCLDALLAEQNSSRTGRQLMLKARFLELIVLLSRVADDRRGTAAADPAVRDAIGFMEASFAETLQLHQIADHVLLSPGHFSQRFKQATGSSPWEYLLRLRIDAAKRMLRTSSASITVIALAVGFSDHSHFTKAFRQREGRTPSSYRQSGGSDHQSTASS